MAALRLAVALSAAANVALAQQMASPPIWSPQDSATPASAQSGGATVGNTTHFLTFGGLSGDSLTVMTTPQAFSVASTVWTPQPAFPGAALGVMGGAIAPVGLGISIPGVVTPPTSTLTLVFGGARPVPPGTTNVDTNTLIAITTAGAVVVQTNGTGPSARRNAAAVYLSSCFPGPSSQALPTPVGGACLLVFGGLSGSTYLSDMFLLDLTKNPPVWSAPKTTGPAPSGRHSVAAVASGDGTTADFFGGRTASGPSNDLFSFAPGGFAEPTIPEMNNLARQNGFGMPTAQSSTGEFACTCACVIISDATRRSRLGFG